MFKVGDKVKIESTDSYDGACGEIISIQESGSHIYSVKIFSGFECNCNNCGGSCLTTFFKVEELILIKGINPPCSCSLILCKECLKNVKEVINF